MSVTIPPPTPEFRLKDAIGTRKFTVAEYHHLIDLGDLGPDDRVELLDGYLVMKAKKTPPRCGTIQRTVKYFLRTMTMPDEWQVHTQSAITLSASEPEPDVTIVRGDERSFDHRRPLPSDIGIVMEVADVTLLNERRERCTLYAWDGISIYWLLNVADHRIEVYTDPQPDAAPPAYATRTDYHPGDAVPVVLDGQTVGTIPVADLLP